MFKLKVNDIDIEIDEGITVSDIDVLNIFFDFGFDEDKTE